MVHIMFIIMKYLPFVTTIIIHHAKKNCSIKIAVFYFIYIVFFLFLYIHILSFPQRTKCILAIVYKGFIGNYLCLFINISANECSSVTLYQCILIIFKCILQIIVIMSSRSQLAKAALCNFALILTAPKVHKTCMVDNETKNDVLKI